uniref:Uncharacterized protein n=1 Tax=Anguilla anguilla TaxID=7936 RepID=A0A0E9U3Q9_ANGAN
MGFRSGLCASQSSSPTLFSTKAFLNGPRCVPRGIVMLKQEKGPSPKLLEKHRIV